MSVASNGQTDFLPMGGGTAVGSGVIVECSVGQVFCEYATIRSDVVVVGEGVQQPYESMTSTVVRRQQPLPQVKFTVYPNPSQQGTPLKVDVSGAGDDSRLQVFDLLGRRLLDMAVTDGTHTLPVSLPAGSYSAVLRQGDDNGNIQKFTVR